MGMRRALGIGGSVLTLVLAGCTGSSSGLGPSADCMALTPELTKTKRPAAAAAASEGMCRPKDWTESEVAADFEVEDGTVWLASGDCVMFGGRVWRSEDDGQLWEETGRLGTGLHCSAGSKMELTVTDEDTAEVAVTNGALIQTLTLRTENAGKSWKRVGLRCLNSDDPKACG